MPFMVGEQPAGPLGGCGCVGCNEAQDCNCGGRVSGASQARGVFDVPFLDPPTRQQQRAGAGNYGAFELGYACTGTRCSEGCPADSPTCINGYCCKFVDYVSGEDYSIVDVNLVRMSNDPFECSEFKSRNTNCVSDGVEYCEDGACWSTESCDLEEFGMDPLGGGCTWLFRGDVSNPVRAPGGCGGGKFACHEFLQPTTDDE